MKTVRIGGGLGFYGDSYRPALDLITGGDVQYVGFDHLSELTLAILQKDHARDRNLGFAQDLLPLMQEALPLAAARGIRLISNAGGLNLQAASRRVAGIAVALGLDLSIGVVTGDDVRRLIEQVAWLDGVAPPGPVAFASAYLGALPVKRALGAGADVVLTGRVADSALFLGALAHAFDWALPGEDSRSPDWDILATGAVAGHLLECSGQASGGNHSGDWRAMQGLDHLGYPIAEVGEDGSLTLGKATETGGRVTFATVREQLLYEVQDPASYFTPDVTVDLSRAEVVPLGEDRVAVRGVRGKPPQPTYKILAGYEDGYLGQGMVGYSWPQALEKAEAAAEILRRQAAALGLPAETLRAEYLGLDSLHGPLADRSRGAELNEVYLRVTLRTRDRRQAQAFARLVPPLALNGPPTASGFIGVDRVRQLFGARAGALPHAAVDGGVEIRVGQAKDYLAEI